MQLTKDILKVLSETMTVEDPMAPNAVADAVERVAAEHGLNDDQIEKLYDAVFELASLLVGNDCTYL